MESSSNEAHPTSLSSRSVSPHDCNRRLNPFPVGALARGSDSDVKDGNDSRQNSAISTTENSVSHSATPSKSIASTLFELSLPRAAAANTRFNFNQSSASSSADGFNARPNFLKLILFAFGYALSIDATLSASLHLPDADGFGKSKFVTLLLHDSTNALNSRHVHANTAASLALNREKTTSRTSSGKLPPKYCVSIGRRCVDVDGTPAVPDVVDRLCIVDGFDDDDDDATPN